MSTRVGYTVLGWITWQVATRVAKRKMSQNKVKIGAGAMALGVLAAGAVAAKVASSGGDQ